MSWKLLWSLALCASSSLSAFGAIVAEPATVFYGKVWGAGSTEPFLVSTGELRWTIRRADGADLTLRTSLRPLHRGEFSYRLDVPHDALALDLSGSANRVPLGTTVETHTHGRITVEGLPARILGPSGATFDAAQVRRAATYRLDLVVSLGAPDADGNGIPDWWERRHGLTEADGDPDGDGLSNLGEFRLRSDPRHDDRVPSLATREIRAHTDGTTVVRLRAIDANSTPAQLSYTLTRAPEEGTLFRRNATTTPGAADQPLAVGANFSQADLLRSQIVFVHSSASSSAERTRFEVVLRDEDPVHDAATSVVAVVFYRPAGGLAAATLATAASRWPEMAGVSAADQPLVTTHLLGQELGYVIGDAYGEGASQEIAVPSSELTRAAYDNQYLPRYGPDRHHVLLGGLGGDTVSGGMEDDVIVGGPGDDTLRGGGGGDLFVLTSPDDGNDTLADFSVGEHDTLDISRALVGTSLWLSNYVQLALSGTNSLLRIDPHGTGHPGTTLTLSGAQLTNLYDLVESGRLLTGDKALPARVTLVASVPGASENGPVSGAFRLSRSGPAGSALTVNLQITGPAANGVDYAYVNPQATLLPGESSLTIEIAPYVDTLTELNEVVQLSVLPGDAYALGAATTAQVTIADLAPRISIEALEPVAVKSDLTPGVLLVTRAGVLDRSVLVRLNVGGTASATDYTGVPAYVNLGPWETTALLEVAPRATAVLGNGVEYVQVSIRPDAAYQIVAPFTARVLLVEEPLTFGLWRDRFFAGTGGDLAAFANEDPGQTGVRAIQRYAFGLDARVPQTSPGRPLFQVRDHRLTVAFRRPVAVTDVSYLVEISEDLTTWHAGEGYVEPYPTPEYANEPEMVCYSVTRSMSEARSMFLRVRPVYAP